MTAVELPALYVDGVSLLVSTPRLVLVNRDPGPAESRVPIDSTLALELVDTGPSGVHRAATRVWVGGVLAFEGRAIPELASAFAGSRAIVTQTADTLRIVLDPTTPLASQATVLVRVVSATGDAVATLDEVYSFVVEDRTAPRVVAAQAVGQCSVRVEFDEPVMVPHLTAVTITPLGAPAVPVTVVAAAVENSVVELTLDPEMTPDIPYLVVTAGVTDLVGNPAQPPFDRTTFVGFRPARPYNRHFDLWWMLPQHNRRDDQTGDLFRFISCLQELTDLLLTDSDRWPSIFDLERAPEPFLDLILRDLGNPFPFELTLAAKRRLARVLVEMYEQKATEKGIRNAVRFFLGVEISAISPFAGDTLVLGGSELDHDWVLGPSDRFARYAFNVEVARVLSDEERAQLRAIVEYAKPGHTHFVDLLEPVQPPAPAHWELGFSDLGESTSLH